MVMKQDILSLLDGLLEELKRVDDKVMKAVDLLIKIPEYSRLADYLEEENEDFLGEVLFPLIIEIYDRYVEEGVYSVTTKDRIEVFERTSEYGRKINDYFWQLHDLEPVEHGAIEAEGILHDAQRMVTEAIVDYIYDWETLMKRLK